VLSVTVHFAARAGSIGRSLLIAAATQVYRGEKLRAAEISYVIVNDRVLRKMNRTFLGHDYETDVITFPLDSAAMEAEIYISIDTARRQAARYRVPLRDELARLAIHGFLHLCGYDDTTEALHARMFAAQERHLSRVKRLGVKGKLT
jgi:probable rRNA maturation factor